MNYIDIIGRGFPTVQCHIVGDTSIYENLVWDAGDPIPPQEVLDEYENNNPAIDETSINGNPAYIYEPLGIPISIEKNTLVYSIKTSGARNFWLNSANADGSSLGYFIDVNSIIKKITFSTKDMVNTPINLNFREPGENTNILQVTIPPDTLLYSISELTTILSAGSQLSCYINSNAKIKDVIVFVDIAQTY